MSVERFLILASPRTGSNLLVGLLNRHPQATCEGELFHEQKADQILWANPKVRQTQPGEIELRNTDPVSFVKQAVYTTTDDKVRASGFKIFYTHASRADWAPLWPWFEAEKGVKIIHLRRRNELRRLLSEELAARSNRWFALDDSGKHDDTPIEIAKSKCKDFFERAKKTQERFANRFADHQVLDLFYEEFAADPAIGFRGIEEFLGLEHAPVETRLKKQTTQPPSQLISNFTELAGAFAGTEWSAYFETADADL